MKNKNKGNENKIILGDFNWRNKMERDGGNKIISRCCFNYALSKLVVDNGLKDLWRRDNPDFPEFTCYNRSSGTSSRIDRVYTDVKIASNTSINRIMVSFTDHYNAIFIDRLPSQIKIGQEDSWYFNNSVLCKPQFSSTTKTFFIKNTKKPLFSK